MKVAALLEQRRRNWQELEQLCVQMEGGSKRRLGGRVIARFAALYRATCADLALAGAYHLPPNTTRYLHQLVGRAHNQLYRSRTFYISSWISELVYGVPRRLYRDNCLRLAFFVFYGALIGAMLLARGSRDFTERVVGKDQMTALEQMHSDSVSGTDPNSSAFMFGFYQMHNTGIGLQCFASGLLLGIGGLFATLFNAVFLGSVFGFLSTTPSRGSFFQFVTAHGPFELNAIVLSAAAGMRLGFSIVDTQGLSRLASLHRATRETVPTMCVAAVMFAFAAMIEAFVSPSATPYWVKATVMGLSSGLLLFYFVMLGHPRAPK